MDTIEEAIDYKLVKKRSLSGVISLISRSFLIQLIAFASNFLLTIFLDVKTFGIFFLVSASINIFRYFSDIGLAAALIQKKERITDEDLKTTFTVQQLLVGILVIIIFLLSPFLRKWLGIDQSAIYLLYALGISFFLTSLKTIPSILLERTLKFNLLIIPQILETLVYSVLVVILAWKGFGINSFTIAVLVQGVVGLIAMYIVSPWKIGFAFSKESLRKLLKFGVPYQANTFVAAAKDDLMTIVLGKIIGTMGLGYLGWAKKWAEQPLRMLMDNVTKVAFPAYSRLQDDKESLKHAVEKSIFFLTFFTFPVLMGMSLVIPDLVKFIPKYIKWQPAVFALYLYSFNSAWAVVSSSMTNLLNSIGKIKTTFKLMIMWLVLTWALMPILGTKYGFNGVALAVAIIALSSYFSIYFAKKEVNFNILNTIGKPLLATIIMGTSIYLLNFINFSGTTLIISKISVGIIVYSVFSYIFYGDLLKTDILKVFSEFRKKIP